MWDRGYLRGGIPNRGDRNSELPPGKASNPSVTEVNYGDTPLPPAPSMHSRPPAILKPLDSNAPRPKLSRIRCAKQPAPIEPSSSPATSFIAHCGFRARASSRSSLPCASCRSESIVHQGHTTRIVLGTIAAGAMVPLRSAGFRPTMLRPASSARKPSMGSALERHTGGTRSLGRPGDGPRARRAHPRRHHPRRIPSRPVRCGPLPGRGRTSWRVR